MTHYSNDYFDLAADQANPTPTHWSGGSRVLPAGWLTPRAALRIAIGLGVFMKPGSGKVWLVCHGRAACNQFQR